MNFNNEIDEYIVQEYMLKVNHIHELLTNSISLMNPNEYINIYNSKTMRQCYMETQLHLQYAYFELREFCNRNGVMFPVSFEQPPSMI